MWKYNGVHRWMIRPLNAEVDLLSRVHGSVEEAIEIHYGETKPPEKETVIEDMPSATIEIPIDNPIQVHSRPIESRPVVHDSGDILIDLDDDVMEPQPTKDTQTSFSSFAGWMRGRK